MHVQMTNLNRNGAKGNLHSNQRKGMAAGAYCILATIENVCGIGCLKEQLHILTDYPVKPEPCLPRLQHILASRQGVAVRSAIEAEAPLGVTSSALVTGTDLFVPSTERLHGSVVYEGLHSHNWMYRCGNDDVTWVISADKDGWSRCDGEIRLNIMTAQAETLRTVLAVTVGVHFDLGFERCAAVLENQLSEEAAVGAEVHISPMHAECELLYQVDRHAAGLLGLSASALPRTLYLPSEPIELVGDIYVRSGQVLSLRAVEGASAQLILGKKQIRVAKGGRLELVGITVRDSVGGSAIYNEGRLELTNTSFTGCNATSNAVVRYLEAVGPLFQGGPQLAAPIGSVGGALTAFFSASSVIARGSMFEANAVVGGAEFNWYAAAVHLCAS